MFHAVADSTRRAMVERLVRGPASVGRVRTVQLAPSALTAGRDWISEQRLPAERQLDRLGAVLAPGHDEGELT
jgi:hypothetical protein